MEIAEPGRQSPLRSLSPKRKTIARIQEARQVYISRVDSVLLEEGYDEDDEVVIGYEQHTLSTLRVFCVVSGTIFRNIYLIVEQVAIVLVFTAVYFLAKDPGNKFERFKVDTLLTLVKASTALAAFLLGFYTSNSLARWWRLRTDGIGNIWCASSELCLHVSQWAHPGGPDSQVLSSIRRYARASLMIVFMKHRGQLQNLDLLVVRNILTAEEVQSLKAYNNNLSESLWSWVYAIVMKLHNDGTIKSEFALWKLLDSVTKGRAGAALIGAQMGTPLPVQYVHILGFMVKLHNLLCAFVYGVKAGCEVDASGREAGIESFFLAFFPPLLYNSVLIINAQLANPFALGSLAFPLAKYDRGIESDGRSYIEARQHLPAWISNSHVDDRDCSPVFAVFSQADSSGSDCGPVTSPI